VGRRRGQRVSPAPLAIERREEWHGVDYAVRPLSGASSTKTYRCPGCEQEIRPATPHVVVWPTNDLDAGERRHWHTGCWNARDRRSARNRRLR